jgi:predicted MFS family arabinose efflux permease
LAVFAMGTSEFMLARLLPDMLAFVLVFAATHAASTLTTSFPVLLVAPAVVAL